MKSSNKNIRDNFKLEKYLSRKLSVIGRDNVVTDYVLTILKLYRNINTYEIFKIDLEPFEREIEGVVFIDKQIVIRQVDGRYIVESGL